MELSDLFEKANDHLNENFIILDDKKIQLIIKCDHLSGKIKKSLGFSHNESVNIILSFLDSIIDYDPLIFKVDSPGNPYSNTLIKFLSRKIAEWAPTQVPYRKTFLVDLYKYTRDKIIKSHQICVICDVSLDIPSSKPTCCTDQKCVFSYEEFGMGREVELEFNIEPEVSELVLIIAATALSSCPIQRSKKIWASVPTYFHEKTGIDSSLERMKTSYKFLEENAITDLIDSNKFNPDLNSTYNGIYSFVKWIFNFNRAGLSKVPSDQQIKVMKTKFQYRLAMHNIQHEKRFLELKKKYGSEYVWHGTPIYNLQHIIQFGLKNYSNTAMMSGGSAYGPGIYFATNTSVSTVYSPKIKHDIKSKFFENKLNCIMLCEIANIKKFQKGNYFVVPDSEYVNVRMLFVYGAEIMPNVDASSICDSTILCELDAEIKLDQKIPIQQANYKNLKHFDTYDKINKPLKSTQLRLANELKLLDKTQSFGFYAEPNDDNMLTWNAKIWLTEGTLAKDLKKFSKKFKQDFVKLSLDFPDDYPNNPPFVWIVSPVLEYRTGFVSRGAICNTILVNTGTKAGWSSAYTIETILMSIIANFNDPESGGKIRDFSKYREYTREEAREGWKMAKANYGW